MRTAALAIAAFLAVSLAPASLSLPAPGQDDAGSGTDASDGYRPPLLIGQGTYRGNTSWGTDGSDVYRVDPPPGTVVRVAVETPEFVAGGCMTVNLELSTRYGTVGPDVCMEPGAHGEAHRSITSGEGEPVVLAFNHFTEYEANRLRPYRFTVSFEVHEHALALRGGEHRAGAWSAHLPEGQWGRVEIYTPAGFDDYRPHDEWYLGWVLFSDTDDCGWWTAESAQASGGWWTTPAVVGGRAGLDEDSVVWTQGFPVDTHIGPPVSLDPAIPGTIGFTPIVETPVGNVSVHVGQAWDNGGLGMLGWVVWDGPDRPIVENRSARATWLSLEDFDDSGVAVQAGPYAEAWNVSKRLRLHGDGEETAVVVADGTTPATNGDAGETGRRETVMEVTPPGEGTVVLEDASAVWGWPGSPDSNPAPPGDWTFRIRQSSGGESDHVRVAMVEWGIPSNCPVEEPGTSGTGTSAESGDGHVPAEGDEFGPGDDCSLACWFGRAAAGVVATLERLSSVPGTWFAGWS